MKRFQELISLANLLKRRMPQRRRVIGGQIATLLLLFITIVLIFVLFTANIGQMSTQAVRVANAADSSALLLGSQLAAKSTATWEAMGKTERRCRSGGILAMLLAIVIAIVAIVVTWGAATPALAAAMPALFTATGLTTMGAAVVGAVGGAIGGAIGGGIAGTGALMGAIQGFMVGAAIGAGIGSAASAFGPGASGLTAASDAAIADAAMAMTNEAGLLAVGDGASGVMALSDAAIADSAMALTGETGLLAVGDGASFAVPGGITITAAEGGATVFTSEGSTTLAGGQSMAMPATGGFMTSGAAGSINMPLAVGRTALSAGANLYTATVADNMREDAIAAAAKALSGMTEYDRFRESAMQQAFLQTVDDPTMVPDTEDTDGDGDKQELVPFFQVWWASRAKALELVVPILTSITSRFINGPLASFNAVAEETFGSFQGPKRQLVSDPEGGLPHVEDLITKRPGYLARGGLEDQRVKDAGVVVAAEGVEGVVVELARKLAERGRPVSLWKSGPTAEQLNAFNDAECEQADCGDVQPPPGFDDVDFTIGSMEDFSDFVRPEFLDAEANANGRLDTLTATWHTWVRLFYDPDEVDEQGQVAEEHRTDYYDMFEPLVAGGNGLKGLQAWKQEIEDVRKRLPVCEPELLRDPDGNIIMNIPVAVVNSPCRGDGLAIPVDGGSVDQDLDDEFSVAQAQLGRLSNQITIFRQAVKQYHTDMNEAYKALKTEFGGLDKSCYGCKGEWRDSRGLHAIRVEVGPFRMAWVQKQVSGNFLIKKVCMILRDFRDNGSRAYVRILRWDPKKESRLWTWNPHGNETLVIAGEQVPMARITKISGASYTYNSPPSIGRTK